MDGWLRLPAAGPGQRVGLLGGSFNPPHDGHRQISLEAMQRLGLDRVWWLVSPGNPLKSHAELESLESRLRQARSVADHPRIAVTGLETLLGTAYTAETLAYLRRRRPDLHLVWLMGADNLAGFDRWRHWRRIMALMPVAIIDRPGWRLPALAAPAAHPRSFRSLYHQESAGPAGARAAFRILPVSSS